MYLLPLAAMGFCILMIRMSDSIAHRLIAEDGEAKTGTAIDRDAVATIAFATVGLLLLCGGIQRLAGVCANYLIFYSAQQQGSVSMLHSGLVEAIVKFAVGLWLFLRADGLVGLWRTLRTAPSATS